MPVSAARQLHRYHLCFATLIWQKITILPRAQQLLKLERNYSHLTQLIDNEILQIKIRHRFLVTTELFKVYLHVQYQKPTAKSDLKGSFTHPISRSDFTIRYASFEIITILFI
jgi:hypothetical protein